MNRELPPPARWLLALLVPEDWRDSVAGDLIEERARRRARKQAAGAVWTTAATARIAAGLALERRRDLTANTRATVRRITMDGLLADLKQAARALRAQPGYTATAALTLALGIGANTAVFNLANWLLFRPVPGVVRQDRLVSIGFGSASGVQVRSGVSYVDFETLRNRTPALKSLAGYQSFALHIAPPGGSPQRLDAEVVTGAYFHVLEGALARGRGFSADEGSNPAAAPAAVISHRLWTRGFGSASDIIGRPVLVNGHPFIVIGVTTRGFHGASLTGSTDLWVSVAQHTAAIPQYPRSLLSMRQSRLFFGMTGRLDDGARVETAAAQLDAARATIAAAHPEDSRMTKWRFDVVPGVESRPWVLGRLSRTMTLLLGVVGLLLALTCANVGSLLLARATARSGEAATRLALGASRMRVGRLLGAESLLLSLVASVPAIAIVWWSAAAFEGTVITQALPPLDRAEIDLRVLAYAIGSATIVACL
ncbi:MAG: ABC transporter permease, partial [Acidobacteriota bacterium]